MTKPKEEKAASGAPVRKPLFVSTSEDISYFDRGGYYISDPVDPKDSCTVYMIGDQQIVRPDFKYARIGYVSVDSFSDACAAAAMEILPPNDPDFRMPKRWRYHGAEHFKETYGEGVVWIRTASYHQLVIHGNRILRLWTNTPKSCKVVWEAGHKVVFLESHDDLPRLKELIRTVRSQYGIQTL